MKAFRVGGCVRDAALGVDFNDVDFVVQAESFEAMLADMEARQFTVFQVKAEFFVVRAKFPGSRLVADFAWCQADGLPAPLSSDLAKRDFTVNAMAECEESGQRFDPHGGAQDLADRVLKPVSSAEDCFRSDAVRVLRALRFSFTREMRLDESLVEAFSMPDLPELMAAVSAERRQAELSKMFEFDSVRAMRAMMMLPSAVQDAVFAGGVWMKASTAKR